MAGYVDGGYDTVEVQQSTDRNLRVKPDGTIAGATDRDIGITIEAGQPETGESGVRNSVVTVSLVNKQGTQQATLEGSVAADQEVYTASGGKVSATALVGSYLRGITQQSGTNGQIIEIMPLISREAVA